MVKAGKYTATELRGLLLSWEAARLLGVSPARVRQMARAGELAAVVTVSGVRLFWRKDVEALQCLRSTTHHARVPR